VLVGIGLARFAYTPLIPALIDAAWFSASQAAYLGAANLAGYLAGALFGRRLAAASSTPLVLRAMLVVASVSFFASATPVSLLWFCVWRLAAGIAASGTLVPLLLQHGLAVTWCGLGALALVLTALSWRSWPEDSGPASVTSAPPRSGPVLALYVEYGLNAFGLVPHMVFLVVYVALGLGQGIVAGAQYWVLFGIGAAVGPVLAGRLADRIGFCWALRLTFAVQTIAVALVVLPSGALGLAVSSVVIGATLPGVVPLVLGRVSELVRPEQVRAAWSFATTGFAVGQAAGAYGMSYLFARTDDYALLFTIGAAAIFLGLLVDLGFGRRR
jgi:predicted MFS family arabinose efflux permease